MRSVADLVKTYKLVNDPSSPSWSVRFVGALVLVGAIVAGGAALWWLSAGEHDGQPNAFAVTSQPSGPDEHVDYVGYVPGTFDAALGFDPSRVDDAMAVWNAAHPGVVILEKTPTWSGSHLIGYTIHYRY